MANRCFMCTFCKNINIFAKTWCIYTSLVSNESLHIALYYCMTLKDVWPYTCTLWTDLMPIIGKNRQFRYLISDSFLLWNQAYFSQTSDVLCASSCKMLNNNSEPIKLNSYESSDCFRVFNLFSLDISFYWHQRLISLEYDYKQLHNSIKILK